MTRARQRGPHRPHRQQVLARIALAQRDHVVGRRREGRADGAAVDPRRAQRRGLPAVVRARRRTRVADEVAGARTRLHQALGHQHAHRALHRDRARAPLGGDRGAWTAAAPPGGRSRATARRWVAIRSGGLLSSDMSKDDSAISSSAHPLLPTRAYALLLAGAFLIYASANAPVPVATELRADLGLSGSSAAIFLLPFAIGFGAGQLPVVRRRPPPGAAAPAAAVPGPRGRRKPAAAGRHLAVAHRRGPLRRGHRIGRLPAVAQAVITRAVAAGRGAGG